MLGKCFKYEFKSFARILVPLLVACFAANILLFIYIKLALREDSFYGIFSIMGLIPVVYITTFGSIIVCFIQGPRRFYASMLSKEAYLIRTLPVSPHIHVLSIMLNSLLWFFVCFNVLLISFMAPPFEGQYSWGTILELADVWKSLFSFKSEFNIIHLLTLFFFGQIVVMIGIVVGSIIGKGSRVVIAVFVYLSYNAFSFLGTLILVTYSDIINGSIDSFDDPFNLLLVYGLVVIFAGYFGIMQLIKKKADVY